MSQSYKNIKNSASRDFKSFTTPQDLPLVGVTEGTIAYVETVKSLYIYDDGAWYGIKLRNDPPVITSAPPARVVVTTNTTYDFNLLGEDPDGIPVTWSFEVIEGNPNFITASLTGNSFSLQHNVLGQAVVIRFIVSDGENTASSETRFVLDQMIGMDEAFSVASYQTTAGGQTPTRFEPYDVIGGNGFKIATNRAYFHINNNFNLVDDSFTDEMAEISFSSGLYISANNRMFNVNGSNVTEYDVENFNGVETTISSPSALPLTETPRNFFTEAGQFVYLVSTGGVLQKYFISSTVSSDWVLVTSGTHLIEDTFVRGVTISGDKLIITDGSLIEIFDKNTLVSLGSTTVNAGSVANNSVSASGNYLAMGNKLFDFSDPNNITQVFDFTNQQTVTVVGLYILAERVLVIEGRQDDQSDKRTRLYNFDSIRGTLTLLQATRVTSVEVFTPQPLIIIDDKAFFMQRVAVNSVFQLRVLQFR